MFLEPVIVYSLYSPEPAPWNLYPTVQRKGQPLACHSWTEAEIQGVLHGSWQKCVATSARHFHGNCVTQLLLVSLDLRPCCVQLEFLSSLYSFLNDSVTHKTIEGYVFYCLASNWYNNIYKRTAFAWTPTQQLENQQVGTITGEVTISDHTIIIGIKVIFVRNVSPKKKASSSLSIDIQLDSVLKTNNSNKKRVIQK